MAVKIRLRREGRKKTPMYRIVVADSRAPRDGRFLEIVGQYQPRFTEGALNLNTDRVNYWLDVGAQPTDTVRSLLRKAGVLKARHESRLAAKLGAAAVPLSDTLKAEAPVAEASAAKMPAAETPAAEAPAAEVPAAEAPAVEAEG